MAERCRFERHAGTKKLTTRHKPIKENTGKPNKDRREKVAIKNKIIHIKNKQMSN